MIRPLSPFVLAVALFGCAGTTQEAPPSTVTTTSAVVAAGVADTERAPRVEPKPVETFTDDQILGLLATFNAGEIDLAAIAQERAHEPAVKRFASILQKDHTEAREEEARLSERLVMRPATTDKMRAMQIAAQQEADKLRGMTGHDFDVEFVSNQVDQQRDCLAMIDVQLIPSSRIAEIKAHLAQVRDQVDHHYRDGTELKRTLGGPIVAQR
jgi:predicted outer membrane protein